MESRFAGIGITLVIIAALVGYKFMQKGDRAEEIRQQVMTQLEALPDFETHALLYTTWFDAHHDTIFEQHFHMGGRRVPARFDGDEYIHDLFTAMVVDATAAGYEEQADRLRELGDSLYIESE
ncbi:MAG TPA: hypothetical protein VFF69_05450 [Phycisphaerales bacterium]|nr:hypothetical protein [Phycisphaerales bacterium]